MSRTFASRVSSRRLKWVILVFWLVLAALAAPLAGGLTDQQDNDIASWLPGDAESTVALERQIALGSDPDTLRAAVAAREDDGLSRKEAIVEVAKLSGVPRREVYDLVHKS